MLRCLLRTATDRGFVIDELSAEPLSRRALADAGSRDPTPMVEVLLRVRGKSPVNELAAALSEVDDVAGVWVGDDLTASD